MSYGRSESGVERFRLQLLSRTARDASTGRTPYDGRFLKGPIPLPWLQAACKCPGKAVHVGVVLWYLAGLNRSKVGLKCSYGLFHAFGIQRHSAYRALRSLEGAQLITVVRGHGRCPLVSLMVRNGLGQDSVS